MVCSKLVMSCLRGSRHPMYFSRNVQPPATWELVAATMLRAPSSFPQSWRQNGGFRERIRSKRANGREFRAQSDCEPLGSSAGYGTSQSSLIWVAEEFKSQISTLLGNRHLVMLHTPVLREKPRNVILSIHWTGLWPHHSSAEVIPMDTVLDQ